MKRIGFALGFAEEENANVSLASEQEETASYWLACLALRERNKRYWIPKVKEMAANGEKRKPTIAWLT